MRLLLHDARLVATMDDQRRRLTDARVLIEDETKDPRVMATALRHLPQQQLPSQVVVPGLLDGQENVDRLVDKWLARGRRPQLALARRRARR